MSSVSSLCGFTIFIVSLQRSIKGAGSNTFCFQYFNSSAVPSHFTIAMNISSFSFQMVHTLSIPTFAVPLLSWNHRPGWNSLIPAVDGWTAPHPVVPNHPLIGFQWTAPQWAMCLECVVSYVMALQSCSRLQLLPTDRTSTALCIGAWLPIRWGGSSAETCKSELVSIEKRNDLKKPQCLYFLVQNAPYDSCTLLVIPQSSFTSQRPFTK